MVCWRSVVKRSRGSSLFSKVAIVVSFLLMASLVTPGGAFLVVRSGRVPVPALLLPYCTIGRPYFPPSSPATTSTQIKMSSSNDDEEANFWRDRIEAADPLEVRLDATLAMCHTLARFLSYDMTLTPKETPQLEVADLVLLVDTFTSAVVLALFWTVAGLLTKLFEDAQSWSRLTLTSLLAAPVWLGVETALGWPAAGADGPLYEHIIVGSIGLWGTMCLGRVVSSLWF